MRKEIVAVDDAVGKILCHDVTRIARGEFKGRLFKKGHRISENDIDMLKQVGKEHVYIIDLDEDDIHEDEAGLILGRAAGRGLKLIGPIESRVNFVAVETGVLDVDIQLLEQINALPDIILATLPSKTVVYRGEIVAGTKVIPLVVKKELMKQAEEIIEQGSMVQVKPFQRKRIGVVITGGEIYKNRISDSFGPLLKEKITHFGSEVTSIEYAPDNAEIIDRLIRRQVNGGADIVMVTGGMSVDPDDVTPAGITMAGAEIIQYGAPVLPGAMFLMAYLGHIPVLGIPACGMFFRTTILDLLLPRILVGERITRKDIIGLAHGGLCRVCEQCHFPRCSFGSGGCG